MEKTEQKKEHLLEGSVLKGFILFALPLFAGSLFQQLYGTADLIFVGNHLGKTEAAAVGASGILVTCLIGLFTGIAAGASVITAKYWGARDIKNVQKSIENALILALVGGIGLMVVGQLLARQALLLLNTPESILAQALVYIKIYLLAIMSMIVYNMCAGIMRAMGDSRTPFLVLAIGGGLNVLLDYLFIVVVPFGVAGAAFATFGSQTFTAVCLLVRIIRKEALLKRSWKPERRMMASIIKTGVPLGIQSMILTLSNLFVQYYINGFGEDAVAAFTVYFRVETFLYLPILAFGQAMVTFTGHNYGAGYYDRIRKGVRSCNVFSALVIAALSSLILCFSRPVLGIFCKDPNVVEVARSIILVSFPFYFIYSVMELTGSVVRGLGETMQSMGIVIFALCIVRVLLLGWSVSAFHSVQMVAAVYPVTWLIAMLLFILSYRWCAGRLLQKADN